MSLELRKNVHIMGVGTKTPFTATGGVEPYVYSIVSGGAGGSINSATGLYTAPETMPDTAPQIATVKVVDAASAVATAQVAIGTPLELVCDIIKTEMELTDNQVWIWDQKVKTPNDSRLYIAVGVISCKPFANGLRLDGSGAGLVGVQSTNFQATLTIDAFSRSLAALNRKEEILMALASQYAEQQQAANSFRIFPITTNFINVSEVDGAAIPYRFTLTVNMQYFVTKTKEQEFFDTFEEDEILTDP